MKTVLVAATLLLGGCGISLSVANEKLEEAGDAGVAVTVRSLCAQPYSALVRNRVKFPGLKEGIPVLCGDL